MTNQRPVPLTLGWQALASIDGFKEEAGAVGTLVVPGHDPDVWGLIPRWFGSSLGSHVGSHGGALR